MKDSRITKLANGLVDYSIKAKKGDKVLIEAMDIEPQLVTELVRAIYAKGAYPFVNLTDGLVNREIMMGLTPEYCDMLAKYAKVRMDDMDCYIGIRGNGNAYEGSDVDPKNKEIYSVRYSHPIHHSIRVAKTRWVVLRYPNFSMAQLAHMSTPVFEDFYFDVCTLDYAKMDKALTPLKNLMERTDKVRIQGEGTDLTFSIKGMPAVKCSGSHNIPDGEIYTAPIKKSVNGVVSFNAPSIERGLKFENVRLEFKDGKVIKASANHQAQLDSILDTDDGSRYIGEFAFGVNPYITEAIGDILFDEKISGSFHLALGSAYGECDNRNKSAIHWDLVCIQTPKYGGGKIWFDDVLIRDNGLFIPNELQGLNPNKLK